ncbi:hypothetical protein [Streptomyces griseomycini]|uniref:Uncharacterized protein n=1 Tax=Streptomyces griseomycini TaxID=66895 RepID=A0A7W7VB55_9ACTN|nr:hypothetical protein [Streptomyces griseomycini]MBB4903642.1 hypothetical protein [Streptomyces griseomycini]
MLGQYGERGAPAFVHQQAAMPQEYLEGRTTDRVTWMRTPANLARLATIIRAIEDREPSALDADPHPQEHEQHPQPGPARASSCDGGELSSGTDDEFPMPCAGT